MADCLMAIQTILCQPCPDCPNAFNHPISMCLFTSVIGHIPGGNWEMNTHNWCVTQGLMVSYYWPPLFTDVLSRRPITNQTCLWRIIAYPSQTKHLGFVYISPIRCEEVQPTVCLVVMYWAGHAWTQLHTVSEADWVGGVTQGRCTC